MRMTRKSPGTANPAALRCSRALFWAPGDCAGRQRRRRGGQPLRTAGPVAQTQRRRQVLRRGRPCMAPKSPLTPSLRVCPEGLPTPVSNPKARTAGSPLRAALAGLRSRRPASRLPARPKAPRLPTSTAEAAWPFRLRSGPEGPSLRLKRRSPEGFRRFRDRFPCGPQSRDRIVLRSYRRSNKKLSR